MEHLKQKRWYKITVYLLVAVCIGGFVLFNALKINATKTEFDCSRREPCPYQVESEK